MAAVVLATAEVVVVVLEVVMSSEGLLLPILMSLFMFPSFEWILGRV